jgi:quinolinate synthase
VATETGILHKLRKLNPSGDYLAANEAAVCRFMKTITPAKLLRTVREGVFEVRVEPSVADRARRAIERMIEIG